MKKNNNLKMLLAIIMSSLGNKTNKLNSFVIISMKYCVAAA